MTESSLTTESPAERSDAWGYLKSVARYWIVGLVVLVLAAGAALLLLRNSGATYSAKVQMMAVPPTPTSEADAVFNQTNQSLILQSYQNMATSHIVLDPVAQELGPDYPYSKLVQSFTLSYGGGSLMMSVLVEGASDQAAALKLADTVANSFVANVKKATGMADKPYAPNVVVLEKARPMIPIELGKPAAPSLKQTALVAGLIGVICGGVAMVVARMIRGRR